MWSQVEIPPQHFPIPMSCHERDFRNVEPCFEQAPCRFMAQVVELQIFDAKLMAGAGDGRFK